MIPASLGEGMRICPLAVHLKYKLDCDLAHPQCFSDHQRLNHELFGK
jgi:hypothetical protein